MAQDPGAGERAHSPSRQCVHVESVTRLGSDLEIDDCGPGSERRNPGDLDGRRQEKSSRDLGDRDGGERNGEPRGVLTDVERFFDLFDDRQLALDLFTIVEDARIDAAVRRAYGGILRAWTQMQLTELERRPEPGALPLRQALVENLVRASLDGARTIVWPEQLQGALAEALRLLAIIQVPEAILEHSAAATLPLSQLAQIRRASCRDRL